MRTRLAACAAFASLLTAVIPMATAHAAPTCVANTCDGKSPDAAGCTDDQDLLQEFDGQYAHIALYRSRACQSTWAEASIKQGSNNFSMTLWTVLPEGGRELKYSTTYQFVAHYPYTDKTIMKDWHRSVRVCDQFGVDDRDKFMVPGPTGGDDLLGSICGEWF
ncbi:hypothetical protein ABT095_06875 [Kitasatospora sp. NPDC002227]|uniref:hypothetical protein n=1 Tax=Kitasatospora sp. NPDC002227 TaxID=3154773 RepID=UPI003327ABF7